MKRLTKEEIIEATGVSDLKTLVDLEILFVSCDEIGALDECRGLRRLSMIDNGIKRISNFQPVAVTLTSLCLCDQDITVMENLDLPSLRELFLHRNCISRIDGLNGCPRLRRLWLCQNKITAITGLHAVPELEELWIQANNIDKLQGLETNTNLTILAISGNPISEFAELRRLSALNSLRDLSLQDIHFGRCPIVDDNGFKEFISCYLRKVQFLDGVPLSREKEALATDALQNEVRAFNDTIGEIETNFRRELQTIGGKKHSLESHSSILEKEMAAALRELEGLVTDGRNAVAKQMARQEALFQSNLDTLESNLITLSNKALQQTEGSTEKLKADYDHTESMFCLAERLAMSEAELIDILCDVAAPPPPPPDYTTVNNTTTISTSNGSNQNHITTRTGQSSVSNGSSSTGTTLTSVPVNSLLFQSIGDNSPDFQWLASLLNCAPHSSSATSSTTSSTSQGHSSSQPSPNKRSVSRSGEHKTSSSAVTVTDTLHLYRLYRLLQYSPNINPLDATAATTINSVPSKRASKNVGIQNSFNFVQTQQRVFTILGSGSGAASHRCNIRTALSHNWSNTSQDYLLFFSEASVALNLLGTESSFDLSSEGQGLRFSENESTDNDERLQHTSIEGGGEYMPQLQAAREARVLLFYCALLGPTKSGAPLLPQDGAQPLRIPNNSLAKQTILAELKKIRHSSCLEIILENNCSQQHHSHSHSQNQGSRINSSYLYILPTRDEGQGGSVTDFLSPEFTALCLCHPSDSPLKGLDGGIRGLEARLETMMTEADSGSTSSRILTSFEDELSQEMRRFAEQLEEEVDATVATSLRQADDEVTSRDKAIRALKGEIEQERKAQEAMLRDLRLSVEGGGAGAGIIAGTAGGGNNNSSYGAASGGAGASTGGGSHSYRVQSSTNNNQGGQNSSKFGGRRSSSEHH